MAVFDSYLRAREANRSFQKYVRQSKGAYHSHFLGGQDSFDRQNYDCQQLVICFKIAKTKTKKTPWKTKTTTTKNQLPNQRLQNQTSQNQPIQTKLTITIDCGEIWEGLQKCFEEKLELDFCWSNLNARKSEKCINMVWEGLK